jgi:CelD/BcsL family acetyltransferase involved in cellulose biosynthesis
MDGKIGVLSLMGAGVSDYLDVLVDDGDRGAATQGVKQWLRDSTDWERCEWSELRTSSLLFGIAETLGPRSDVTPQGVCPAVVLGGLARIRDAIPARKWADVACARRRAERGAGLAVDEATAVSLDSVFDRLEALHAARWRERGDSGMLTDPSTCAFHRDASRRLMARGALMLYALRLGSEVAAVLYGFHDRRATRCYLSGFDPAHARQSPGTLVVAHALQEAHRRGADVFDLLRGAEPYKREWGAQDITRIHRISVRRTEADPIGSPPSHCPAPPQPSRSSWAVPR